MIIRHLNTGLFKLDGGAMFGVVPKSMWNKLNPADENNMCTWAMRCLYIEDGDRKIVIDTGMGNKQDARFRSHFYPHGDDTLPGSVNALGVHPEEITDVILTHLHFDHVGGAVYNDESGNPRLTFPNATYWSNELQWKWALDPNPREKASFLKENIVPIADSGRLKFVDVQKDDLPWSDHISLRFVYGHTEAMMLPLINTGDKRIVYCADLMPSIHHIGLPYVMSYDIRPLFSLAEKERMLAEVKEPGCLLFFEHDPVNAVAVVSDDGSGRIRATEIYGSLSEAL